MFGTKKDANGVWRRLHKEELYILYRLLNIVRVIKSRRLRWAGHLTIMLEVRGILKKSLDIPTGKKPLGKPGSRWEDNIRMDLKEIRINTRNWVDWVQDRDYWRALVNAGAMGHAVS